MCHTIRYSADRQLVRRGGRYRSALKLVGLTIVVSFVYGLLASPYFAIREVHIEAPDSELAKQATALITVPYGASTLLYPVQCIAAALDECPQVQRAWVERDLPSRLVIHVWRRYPIAALQIGGQWALVDEQGVCVGSSTARPPSLVHAYGLLTKPLAPGERLVEPQLGLLTETLDAVPDKLLRPGLVMDFTDLHLIQIHSPSGVLGKLGSPDNLKRKIMMFVAIMQRLEEKGKRPAYIDVRIMDRLVWRPRLSS